jgi:D-alanine-D-alanine ligase
MAPSAAFPLWSSPTPRLQPGSGHHRSEEELEAYLAHPEIAGQDLLAEVLIRGHELTCGVLDGETLPPILIRPKRGEFFDYESKYLPAPRRKFAPAPVSAELNRQPCDVHGPHRHDALAVGLQPTDFMLSAEARRTFWRSTPSLA